jgi:ribosome-associated translation inhibitor RaiA
MPKSNDPQRNELSENAVRLGAGFAAEERPHVLATLSSLGPHLAGWGSRGVRVEVSVQNRDGKDQRVTLRTTLPGRNPIVAVANEADLTRALHDATRELIRQLEHQKSMREPLHNRRLRDRTIRHPSGTVLSESTQQRRNRGVGG